ncbi:type III-B CRISPR-associated protein Cas10/Cmr2 [Scytonema sp. UIC 10036]|uniref:type III-B CRISPR-associated protein Cas10/Cmr2 n=1 Tax=Scytonema sp. UIC 10036 TaxID=2304196 RepID=UPI0012DAAF46|nr:type III-B CRISPR-associated protein Cas10/Cmr2 [Scytonema sp. UIC 10036]MUG98261.1 type III-B CRISPR-associated protein Cas10/Cmr2 [Scytonema sp. UIC 10036]
MPHFQSRITTAISWCLAWGNKREPNFDLPVLQQMRHALQTGGDVPEVTRSLVEQVKELQGITDEDFPQKIAQLQDKYPNLWNQTTRIGLVYGGATKIKQYVFEAAKIQDIRGASAILDRINLHDLQDFFDTSQKPHPISKWLNRHFPGLKAALIPELVIYSTGGNILAFCPAAYVHDLANAIERRYTEETLNANSCAVGDTFRLLEIRFGLLQNSIEETKWLDWYQDKKTQADPLVEAYYGCPEPGQDCSELFKNRKSFNELVGKLASAFNKRRSGNDVENVERPSRRYPPMFETHPYLQRDDTERRNAVIKAQGLPKEPWFSEALARKRIVGQQTKLENQQSQRWYRRSGFDWRPGLVLSWVTRFKLFLKDTKQQKTYYQSLPKNVPWYKVRESRNLEDIAESSLNTPSHDVTNGFVAYIYADGNNMGGYIQKIRTPEEYQKFSQDVSDATTLSVYAAIAKHLKPRIVKNSTDSDFLWVHPFEIITIGGDDVLLVVPADKALEIAHTIGEEFEKRLTQFQDYQIPESQQDIKSVECHRYSPEKAQVSQCKLSMSIGVLITAYNTPIYYAQKLTEQLLKSAKARAKDLKKFNYYGGTVDFLVMKSVTMISSKINSFRQEGLTKSGKNKPTLKLYAAPYTLHELEGLLQTGKALKKSGFPRSQLYQIRSLLEQGKNTAILNYRYFRVRLGSEQQKLLQEQFEDAWCQAVTNPGNLAPWIFDKNAIFIKVVLFISLILLSQREIQLKYIILNYLKKSTYETIWRELVDLYPFIEVTETADTTQLLKAMETNQ